MGAFGNSYGKYGCTALAPLQMAEVDFLAYMSGQYKVLTPFRCIISIKMSKQNWGSIVIVDFWFFLLVYVPGK